MKTLVEIYDQQQIQNLLSGYAKKPEKVIFLYQKEQESLIHNEVVEKYVGGNVEYICYTRDNLEDILNQIDPVECAFDIEGGDDFADSIVSIYADENACPILFPDVIRQQMLVLLNDNKEVQELEMPHLSVNEMVALYGGKVRDLPEASFDEEGRRILEACMKVKRVNNRKWVNFTKTMGSLKVRFPDSLTWTFDKSVYNEYRSIFDGIQKMFSSFDHSGAQVRATFANANYIILVTDTGVCFEYDTYYQLLDAGYFDDLVLRVNIDWNGGEFVAKDPNSELDVVGTKDGRMYSISCKAGKYDQQAIYEVKANAVKFGGERAVAILCNDNNVDHLEYVEKAEELGVLLIEHGDMWKRKAAERIIDWVKTH